MEWLVGWVRWVDIAQPTDRGLQYSVSTSGHVGSAGRIETNIVQSHKCNIITKHVIPTITRIDTEDFDS